MEGPNLLENGNIPQERKFSCGQMALVFILVISSALVSLVFCLLHPKQAEGTCWAHGILKKPSNSEDAMLWEWNLKHCDGFVQQDHDQYLLIEQSGNYFIYAQINRKQPMEKAFTLLLYKEPDTILNKVVGPNTGDERGTVNFGRPFFLQKGDKLYCQANFGLDYILPGDQNYWGLYKM